MEYLIQILRENRETYAALITQEMGKPIVQAEGEIDKCISHVQYYLDNMERFIQMENLDILNPAQEGYITH